MKRTLITSSFLCAALFASGVCERQMTAQLPSNARVYAAGLNGPRGLKFGPDNLLYVAEAGTGGSMTAPPSCEQILPPNGPYHGGLTGRVSKIDANGNRTTVVTGLPSTTNGMGDVVGVADVAFLNDTLYAVTTGGGCSHGNAATPNAIVKINQRAGTSQPIVDLSQFLRAHPAAYPDAADFDPDGVFYSMIADQGKLYVVEANHGQVLSTGVGGATKVVVDVSASQGHIVPTSIAARGGNLYVGDLGTFPIVPHNELVLTVSRDAFFFDPAPGIGTGNTIPLLQYGIARSTAGFTTIVGLSFGPDGLLYALELSSAAGYPTGGAGKVVRVKRNGDIEDVVTGLTVPTGMTFGPDGALYVSNLGAAPAGAGQILRIEVTSAQ